MSIVGLVYFLCALILFGAVAYAAWWLIGKVQMQPPIRYLVIAVFVVICILLLVNYFPANLMPPSQHRLG